MGIDQSAFEKVECPLFFASEEVSFLAYYPDPLIVTIRHIRHVSFWKWFPSDDPVAVSVARLCILRKDLYLETTALIEETIAPIDKNGVPWRTMYFLEKLGTDSIGDQECSSRVEE